MKDEDDSKSLVLSEKTALSEAHGEEEGGFGIINCVEGCAKRTATPTGSGWTCDNPNTEKETLAERLRCKCKGQPKIHRL